MQFKVGVNQNNDNNRMFRIPNWTRILTCENNFLSAYKKSCQFSTFSMSYVSRIFFLCSNKMCTFGCCFVVVYVEFAVFFRTVAQNHFNSIREYTRASSEFLFSFELLLVECLSNELTDIHDHRLSYQPKIHNNNGDDDDRWRAHLFENFNTIRVAVACSLAVH